MVGETVTIHRDDWGMPHVRADSEEAGFFGVGYAQAEDQLELILRQYAAVRGELALVDATPAAVASDVRARRWRHLEEARASFPTLDPRLQAAATAFVAGVQQYLADHPERRPERVPDLEPALAVAVTRASLWPYFVLDGLRVCADAGVELTPDVSELAAVLVHRRQEVGASNEWLLMPWRTSMDAVVLLSDPHGSLEGFQMVDFEVEAGPVKYVGFHVIGGVVPFLGHTRHVAWGYTTGSPVVSDCYAVELDPSCPNGYLYDGEWTPFVVETADIHVRGADDPIRHVLEYTRHNGVLSAVVAKTSTTAFVVSSPYMHATHLYEEQLYRQLFARDVGEFRETMRPMGQFPQNVLVGDSSGGAYYVRAGRTPIRPPDLDLTKPLEGNTSATAWQGIHPLDDLVQITDPACGYLQNNNIAPDRMLAETAGTALAADGYPPYVFGDVPGRTNSRGRRAVERLSRLVDAGVEDAIALAVEDVWPGYEHWTAALAHAVQAGTDRLKEGEPLLRRAVQQLLGFDGHAAADSSAALLYWTWRTLLVSSTELSDAASARIDNGITPGLEESPLLLDGLELAVGHLIQHHGSLDVPLGEVFRIGRGGQSWPGRAATISGRKRPDRDHPYDSLVMPLQLMIYGEPDEQGQRWATLGSHTLRLTVLSDPVRSFALLNHGQSGRPGTPHHSDQARLFSEKRLRPTYFDDGTLARHTVSTTTVNRVSRTLK